MFFTSGLKTLFSRQVCPGSGQTTRAFPGRHVRAEVSPCTPRWFSPAGRESPRHPATPGSCVASSEGRGAGARSVCWRDGSRRVCRLLSDATPVASAACRSLASRRGAVPGGDAPGGLAGRLSTLTPPALPGRALRWASLSSEAEGTASRGSSRCRRPACSQRGTPLPLAGPSVPWGSEWVPPVCHPAAGQHTPSQPGTGTSLLPRCPAQFAGCWPRPALVLRAAQRTRLEVLQAPGRESRPPGVPV